jgi:hypothetical protein
VKRFEEKAALLRGRSALCLMPILFFIAAPAQALEKAGTKRHEEVLRRGAQVMPFSLKQTLHIFIKTKTGGLQQVVVKDPSDTPQIKLIREHLSKISKDFARGNFSDPAKIHGHDMPGLAELEKAPPGRLRIEYKEIPKGAQIDYSTDSPKLIEALHRWFDAQLADHAGYASPGPAGQGAGKK